MKRLIFSVSLFFGIITLASAQSSDTSHTAHRTSSSSDHKAAAKKPSKRLKSRRIYHFKDGQRSTPTGNEATPSSTGGQYAALGKTHEATPADTTSAKKAANRKKRKQ